MKTNQTIKTNINCWFAINRFQTDITKYFPQLCGNHAKLSSYIRTLINLGISPLFVSIKNSNCEEWKRGGISPIENHPITSSNQQKRI